MSVWYGLYAPTGTPKNVVPKLNAAAVEALANPTVRGRLSDLGQAVSAREQQAPEALGDLNKPEIEKWWPVIRAANIKGE